MISRRIIYVTGRNASRIFKKAPVGAFCIFLSWGVFSFYYVNEEVMGMHVLVADKLSETALQSLKAAGHEVVSNPGLSADELPRAVKGFDILVVRSTKVKKDTVESADSLSLIIRAGAGVNTIDLESASRIGIHVANCPGKNTDAVAELAMGLLIAADRRIADGTFDLRKGVWNKSLYSKAAGLKGRTLAVIGLGSIGSAVAQRAASFGMQVVAWSRSLTPESAKELSIGYCASPTEAARIADAVSVHLAAAAETGHFIGKDFFEAMKSEAIFVNTSRGEIVDTAALKAAIETKNLKVGLDVYEDEPASGDNTFRNTQLSAVVTGTHHIGASTHQASEAIAEEVVNIVRAYQETGIPLHAVNVRAKSSTDISLVVRHYNLAGVLAGVLDELRSEKINIEEMHNSIFEGGKAAVCTMKLDDMPSQSLLKRIREAGNVIQAVLK